MPTVSTVKLPTELRRGSSMDRGFGGVPRVQGAVPRRTKSFSRSTVASPSNRSSLFSTIRSSSPLLPPTLPRVCKHTSVFNGRPSILRKVRLGGGPMDDSGRLEPLVVGRKDVGSVWRIGTFHAWCMQTISKFCQHRQKH